MWKGKGTKYSSEELTRHNMDKSRLLEQALVEQHGQEAFLGNMQVNTLVKG